MVALLPNKFLYATVLVASYAPIVSAFNRRKKLRHEQQVYLYNSGDDVAGALRAARRSK